MKCANPKCDHGIGLVSYRRGWFNRQRFCSKKCRDEFDLAASERLQSHRQRTGDMEWLFAQPAADARRQRTRAMSGNSSAMRFIPATVRQARARHHLTVIGNRDTSQSQ
jgi:hypothetical protein